MGFCTWLIVDDLKGDPISCLDLFSEGKAYAYICRGVLITYNHAREEQSQSRQLYESDNFL